LPPLASPLCRFLLRHYAASPAFMLPLFDATIISTLRFRLLPMLLPNVAVDV